jgi:hypothetical protein
MAIPRLTNEIIDAAIVGFEEQRRRIDAQLAELHAMRTGADHATPTPESGRPRRKMSAAGRKAIAAAQRQRWAALKGSAASQKEPKAPKKAKRKLSAAGRAAIVAALKKRWAAKKAANKG